MKTPRDSIVSPGILKKKTVGATMGRRSSSKTLTPQQLCDSFSNLDLDEGTIQNINQAVERKSDHAKDLHIHWKRKSSLVMQKRISTMRDSFAMNMFYSDEEIANFKYQKFMEDCGLDPSDFD